MSDAQRLALATDLLTLLGLAVVIGLVLIEITYRVKLWRRPPADSRSPDVIIAHFTENGRDVVKWRRRGSTRWRELRVYDGRVQIEGEHE